MKETQIHELSDFRRASLARSLFTNAILGNFVGPVICARILFPIRWRELSHQISVWPFVTGLAEKGHQVIWLEPSLWSQREALESSNVMKWMWLKLIQMSASNYDVNRFEARIKNLEHELWDTYDEMSLDLCKTYLELSSVSNKEADPDLVH